MLRNIPWPARMVLGVVLLAVVLDAAPPASPNASPTAPAAVPATTSISPLRGAIRSASGAALEGISVTMRPAGKTFSISVFTDEQGEYVFPPLQAPFASGTYRVWAQGVGFETASAEIAIDGTRPARQELTLKTIEDFTSQLSGAEWLDALPVDTFEDRRMKEIFRVNCTECHQAGLAFQNRFDERSWRAVIDVMERASYHGWSGPGTPDPLMRYHKDELAKWLARMRGPEPSPMKFKLRPRPRGDAARHVVIEYGIPLAELPDELATTDGSEWSEGIPSGMRGGGGMHDVAIDNDGNAWVTDSVRNKFRTIVKVDTKTGKVTGFKVPEADGVMARGSHGIYKDRKGLIWFTLGGAVGVIDPATEKVEVYTPPGQLRAGGSLEEDGKGKIWFPSRHGGLQFDPATKKWRYFQAKTIGDGGTYGASGDALGNGWWAQHNQDIVGHADAETGEVAEVRMNPPWPNGLNQYLTPADLEFYNILGVGTFYGTSARPGGQFPRRMSSDRRGAVWVANWWGNNIAKIDITTLKPTYYKLPFPSHAYATVVDKNGMVWTNLSSDDAVARFNPKTEQWTVFKLPSLGAELRYISVDEAGPDVWVVYREASKVTRIHPRTQAELQALKQTTTND
jgi:virginiamycin B lyase